MLETKKQWEIASAALGRLRNRHLNAAWNQWLDKVSCFLLSCSYLMLPLKLPRQHLKLIPQVSS
jgi:hypothetical protein